MFDRVGVVVGALIVMAAPLAARAQQLDNADVRLYAQVLRMADEREVDTALLRTAWRSPSQAVRVEAVRAAGQVHATVLRAEIERLITDADTAVGATAAFALGLLRDTSSVPALSRAVRSAAPTVAREAAWALGQLAPASGGAIASLLSSDSLPGTVTGELLLAAARVRPVPVDRVRPWLAASDPALRWRAAYALARPLAPQGVRLLLPLRADSSADVRAQVARALGAATDSLAPVALGALDTLARDSDAHVRVNALRAAGALGARAADLLLRALGDADANVRIAAAMSLGGAIPAGDPRWAVALAADTLFAYRRALATSMARVGSPALSELGWERSARWDERAALADAAVGAPTPELTFLFVRPLLGDPDARVRAAAVSTVAAIDDTTGPAVAARDAALRRALVDQDPVVRAEAITALASPSTARQVRMLVASYERAAFDTVDDARVASIRALAAAWRRDSAAFEPSLQRLVAALSPPPDADRDTRQAARTLPLLRSWQDTAATLPPLAWYETRVRALVRPALDGRRPRVDLVTSRGTITLELFAAQAPLTVDNFLSLIRAGFYHGTRFHRVVPNFVVQDGDPRGDGNGGPSHTIRDELNRHDYGRGVLGMALSGPDTGGSQYFITLSPQPHLDGGYTVFGRVARGLDVLDSIVQGDAILAMRIR
ncbi:MAG TPA: peptidylprolyl isomerase [Gemmatimonadaceae bacterium]|nr:peptidylprolyl isomerase [Gemmatimonadaceae bacterium]